MQNAWNNLKFALRQLRRSPAFAITAVLTLALGIGANTAIFSLLDQALLRALPVEDPESLVVLRDSGSAWNGSISMSGGGDRNDVFSYPQYLGLRDGAHVFSHLLATVSDTTAFSRGDTSQFASTEIVSGNYFQTLGLVPAAGRLLQPSDDGQPGTNSVAVLSYDFWREKLGADPSVVNSTVSISGHPFQIVGVAAPHFTSAIWGQATAVFVPMSMLQQVMPRAGDRYNDHQYKWLSILGRLQPGVTAESAQAQIAPLWHALRANDLSLLGRSKSATFTKNFMNSSMSVLPGARGFNFNRTTLQKPFLAVMAMAALVLLIASVNVASLLMVRSAGRLREFALRTALGASSVQVLSQLLLEGVLIGVFGGIVGVLIAPFAIRVLISHLADSTGKTPFSASIDHRLLFFNFTVAVAVSLLFSLLPAIQLRRLDLTSTLRESSGTGGGTLLLLRRVVVCLQIGLSVVLLVGAGLFIRTMQQLRAVNLGFNATHLVTFSIDPRLAGYSAASTPAIHQRVLDALAVLPGIQSVAASDDAALQINGSFYGITVSGYQSSPDDSFQVQNSATTPDYLATMQIPLLMGRLFTDADTLGHPDVALVNEVFVRHYCNGNNAACLGRHISYGIGINDKTNIEVVGVFRDYRNRSIRDAIPATMYRPLKQSPDSTQIYVVLRTALEPTQAFGDIRAAMHRVDPSLAVGDLITMDQQIDADLQNERMITLLAVSFGILATLLAGVGLYGVLAYSTAQRTREIGIRMALGSTRLAVSSLILKDVLTLAAIGIVVALPTAYGLSELVRSQLFGVSAADPAILCIVVAMIASVALLSALIPARRAASVSPTVALRTE
ncbi:ABC transporter permease [Acidipila sp. EB88]|uniref:ABC transporter permease n=1 Tax=Acidipila sp. EB88 TaxID=2305226 RepID=UPI000F6039FD|nr:ABC transporter permease [Acidipila sp. EB88]RRA49772.1 permease [Acidipila sp. EB88]